MDKNDLTQNFVKFMEMVDRYEEEDGVTFEFGDVLIAAPWYVLDEESTIVEQGMIIRQTGPFYRRVGVAQEALRVTMRGG